MKNRIIIENRSQINDLDAIEAVKTVIMSGRISNDGAQYCYFTTFKVGNRKIGVATDLNKRSDRFVVVDLE